MKNLKEELLQNRIALNLIQKEYCNALEQKDFRQLGIRRIPSDIHWEANGSFFRTRRTDLSDQEVNDLLLYRQTLYLKDIRNYMMFFVILTIISLTVAGILTILLYGLL